MTAHIATQTFSGPVLSYNLSPKGVPEGIMLLHAGKPVQVNFDPAIAGQVTQIAALGQSVTLEARHDPDVHGDAVHPVFALVRLSLPSDPAVSVVADGAAEAHLTLKGRVEQLNHARRGEVNGAILDNGDFVHLRPHGVRAIGGLAVGQTIEVTGEVRPGWSGHKVIEARTANGIEIGKPPKRPEPKPERARAAG